MLTRKHAQNHVTFTMLLQNIGDLAARGKLDSRSVSNAMIASKREPVHWVYVEALLLCADCGG